MYSYLVTARIKGKDEYQFLIYNGPKLELPFRGIEVPLEKGTKFGVRPSSNGKHIRLVMGDDVNRVFTIPPEVAQKIAKRSAAI